MHELDLPTDKKKKVLIETWGCQMNVADSENMLSMLQKENYTLTNKEADADLVLLNTCHIREKAKHKVLSRLGKLKELKVLKPSMKIAVSGCVAQAEGKKLLKSAPQIDVLFGPGKILDFPQLLKENAKTKLPTMAIGFKRESTSYPEVETNNTVKPSISGKFETGRYVNITQGCDNFCTFCVVPFTRGREISRKPLDIIKECQSLLDDGAKEITLLGQNVNSYGSDLVESDSIENPFMSLLEQVASLPKLVRLRFTTSNPHDFTRSLSNLFSTEDKLGTYLHLPVQSGNDEVLRRMKRKVTADEYLEKVSWLRNSNPNFALSTDLIVGFPGETEAQFEDTLKLVEKVRFNFIFAFMYSPRKNTAAIRFPDQVPEEVKQQRLRRLNQLQDKITVQLNENEIGKTSEVLFAYPSKKEENCYYGRTKEFRLVKVSSSTPLVGLVREVKITNANKIALLGELS